LPKVLAQVAGFVGFTDPALLRIASQKSKQSKSEPKGNTDVIKLKDKAKSRFPMSYFHANG
jgi:hypothetical protein